MSAENCLHFWPGFLSIAPCLRANAFTAAAARPDSQKSGASRANYLATAGATWSWTLPTRRLSCCYTRGQLHAWRISSRGVGPLSRRRLNAPDISSPMPEGRRSYMRDFANALNDVSPR